MTAKNAGCSRAQRNAATSMVPSTANRNELASRATLDQVAKVGRERGRSSPTAVLPAIALLAGRAAASVMPCTPLITTAVPIKTPRTPYWTRCDQLAPATPATTMDNSPVHTALNATARTTVPRAKVYVASSAPDRYRDRPPIAPPRERGPCREAPPRTTTRVRRQRRRQPPRRTDRIPARQQSTTTRRGRSAASRESRRRRPPTSTSP